MPDGRWKLDGRVERFIPDYLNDLNAMHEAENYITEDTADLYEYAINLTKISAPSVGYGDYSCTEAFKLAHASAAQRAEAFLRTLSLWNQ